MTAAIKSTRCTDLPGPEFQNVDPLTVRVFHALGRIMHLNRMVMMKIAAQRGFQPPEAFALTLLSANEGVSQRELAAFLHLSPPRVSMILQALEESGAVERRPDKTDRRLARVFLTSEGRRREEEHRAVFGEYVERTIGALPEDDQRELEKLLGKLADRTLLVLEEEQEVKPRGEDDKPR